MLDINFVRQNVDLVKQSLVNRGRHSALLDQVIGKDSNCRQLIAKVEDLRSQQNRISRQIKDQLQANHIKQAKDLKNRIKKLDDQLKVAQKELTELFEEIPNIPAPDVPIGKDDTENIVIKTVGDQPHFDFQPLDHVDLGKQLDIIDIDKAGQISGSRFGYFKRQAAVLEMALMFYAFRRLVDQGWVAMIPPTMIKKSTEWKMGYSSNKNLANAYYYLPQDDLLFISSSEHSVIPYHLNEILASDSLPKKYINFSPCFRREAGTYGKDTRGLFRVHFFNKVEMNIFSLPDTKVSDQLCLEMLAQEEKLMLELGLPYQVVNCCTGDLPQPNRRMYDINTWFPGQNLYRETQSCSNCTDYQARRLNTRVKINGKNEFVHLLNATLITDRAVLAIIENFQTKEGYVNIPQCLQPLCGFSQIKPI